MLHKPPKIVTGAWCGVFVLGVGFWFAVGLGVYSLLH